MTEVGRALAAGLRAPFVRWRLVLCIWLARLLPIVLAFGLPAFRAAEARSAHHPDAGTLVAPAASVDGFADSWTRDLFRTDLAGAADTVYWLVLACWLLVTVLAGGVVARLVYRRGSFFLAECGYFAGRFLRLALLFAILFYVADAAINGILAQSHAERARWYATQHFEVRQAAVRGLLFLALAHLLGAWHAYARIEIVTRDRRSVLGSLARSFGRLLLRFPRLLVMELGMLALTGLAALVAWILLRGSAPGPRSGGGAIAVFTVLAALGSYLRSGIEVGTLEARCRLMNGATPPSHDETPAPDAAGGQDQAA